MADTAHQTSDPSVELVAIVLSETTAAAIETWCANKTVLRKDIRLAKTWADFTLPPPAAPQRLIVVEAGVASPEAIATVERMAQTGGSTSVIAIIGSVQNEDMRRLFRAGVHDVLSAPVEMKDLVAALDAAFAQHQFSAPLTSAHQGCVYAVIKTAGGVGASTFAINAARELAHRRAGRVALVDLDVQFGALDIALDIESRLNLTDAIRASARLDATMISSMMTPHKTGFDVLTSCKSIAPADVISESFMERFLEQLKAGYDHIILDMPMTWAPWFYTVGQASDFVLPVFESTVRCADGARRVIQGFEALGLKNLPLLPIANRTDKTPETKRRLRQISDILGAPCDALIREDTRTAGQCGDLGICARDVSAAAPLTQDVEAIVARLVASKSKQPDAKPASESNQKFRLFGART